MEDDLNMWISAVEPKSDGKQVKYINFQPCISYDTKYYWVKLLTVLNKGNYYQQLQVS